jgi:hypothetical protein
VASGEPVDNTISTSEVWKIEGVPQIAVPAAAPRSRGDDCGCQRRPRNSAHPGDSPKVADQRQLRKWRKKPGGQEAPGFKSPQPDSKVQVRSHASASARRSLRLRSTEVRRSRNGAHAVVIDLRADCLPDQDARPVVATPPRPGPVCVRVPFRSSRPSPIPAPWCHLSAPIGSPQGLRGRADRRQAF